VTEETPQGGDVHLRVDSLAALDDGRVETRRAVAPFGQPLPLRVKVYSDQTVLAQHHLLVYDRAPELGGQLIAAKVLPGVDAVYGTEVWIDWTPPAPGVYPLHAELVEKPRDGRPGNNRDRLLVIVRGVR
jgi:hypothetical protein